ncbi:MMPL family transporter [Arcanobacterium hippocoleae]
MLLIGIWRTYAYAHRSDAQLSDLEKAIPLRILLLLLWLAALAFGGMAQGKISTVAENNAAVFLPASAESTLADQQAKEFSESQTIPALLAASSKDGEELSAEQFAALKEFAEKIPNLEISDGVKLADLISNPIPVIPNADRTAALMPAAIDSAKANELDSDGNKQLNTLISVLRAEAAAGDLAAANVQVNVSGPAGIVADLTAAFAGIDLTLLLVTLALVFVILVVVYRYVLMPVAVLFTSMAALCAAVWVVFELAKADVFALNSQTQGILAILVIGATTDYCLLMIARYREEIGAADSPMRAMAIAVKGSWEPILASGGTVIAGLLTLMISDLSSTASLGPIAAIGIVFAMIAALTLLPGILLLPRGHEKIMFWPAKIKVHAHGEAALFENHGFWGKTAKFVGKKARPVWVSVLAVLVIFAAFAPSFRASGTSTLDSFLKRTDAVAGFELLAEKFAAGSSQPTTVVVAKEKFAQAKAEIEQISGVDSVAVQSESAMPAGMPEGVQGAQGAQGSQSAQVTAQEQAAHGQPNPGSSAQGLPPEAAAAMQMQAAGDKLPEPTVVDGKVLLNVTTEMPAEDIASRKVVADIRAAVHKMDPDALVGGPAAQALDTQNTANSDFQKIVPVVLGVIFIMLMLLLRSIVAPLLLLIANLISFGATLGIAKLLFDYVLDYPGADATVPIYSFVFLVALGIDYTIFLMSRVREESIRSDTHSGVIRGVTVTGGVITSAGIVLAATFAALGVVPLLFMLQLAIIVALGILIDTFIVRSLLIPGLVYDIGRPVWWPWTSRKVAASEKGK